MLEEDDEGTRFGSEVIETSDVERRTVMRSAVATASALSLAGCSSADEETATSAATDTMTEAMATATPAPTAATSDQTATETTDAEAIHPRFGYTATDPQEEPPVEPDHTVDLLIRPVEGREIPEFYFEPTGLYVEPGDTVKFNLASPHHNVNAYHPAFTYEQRVPDGVPPFSSPILSVGSYWLYTFDTEGVHDYVCAPHEYYGMAGRLVVGSATGPAANPVGEAPAPTEQARAPEFTAGLVLSDEAMAPDRVVEQGSVSWDDLADESKRMLLVPAEGGGE